MTTWTSKAPLALAALIALGACEDGQGAAGLLANLQAPSDAAAAAPVALAQTQMASGAFTLVPPQGFCIDKSALSQRFALMARCDALGAPSKSAGAPVGIITVSVTNAGRVEILPTAQETADAAKLARVDAVKSENDSITFRAEGTPPAAGLDVKHWRGTLRIGGQIVGLALYGPKGGRAETSEGREMLNELIRRSRKASATSG